MQGNFHSTKLCGGSKFPQCKHFGSNIEEVEDAINLQTKSLVLKKLISRNL